MTQKKDSVFIKLLKENTNIDEDFIDTFFKNFKIGGELDYDIKDVSVSNYLNTALSTIRKRLNNSFSKKKDLLKMLILYELNGRL